MSRLSSLSAAAKIAMFSPQTDKVFLPIIKISGGGIASPVRLARNTEDVVSTAEGASNTYQSFPFNIFLPKDSQGGDNTTQLVADGVDQTMVELIRPLTSPPVVTLWIVLADTPNVIEYGPVSFTFSDVTYDAQQMTVTLIHEDRMGNKLEGVTFNPVDCPGVH